MLFRLEKALKLEGCVRAMFSIPSPRARLAKWLNYQGYDQVASIQYPSKFLEHELTTADVTLDMFSKSLLETAKEESPLDSEAQGKSSDRSSKTEPVQRNMHLPPHWRGVKSSADIAPAAATVNVHVEALLRSARSVEGESINTDDDTVDIPYVD